MSPNNIIDVLAIKESWRKIKFWGGGIDTGCFCAVQTGLKLICYPGWSQTQSSPQTPRALVLQVCTTTFGKSLISLSLLIFLTTSSIQNK